MSNGARTDEIDKVISSIREMVSRRDTESQGDESVMDRFVLEPEFLVQDAPDDDALPVPEELEKKSNILILDPTRRAERANLVATITELEAAVLAEPDDVELEVDDTVDEAVDDVGTVKHPVSDLTEENAPDEIAEDFSDEEGAAIGALDDPDELIAGFDEEQLRDLVAQIVREELSGEMGERITRNIRKLVRREINRVLASQGLR